MFLMMKFRTEIEIARSTFTVDHSRQGFIAGSCFSEHIYRKLACAKFPVEANPSGILFNPVSIARLFQRLQYGVTFTQEDIVCANGLWFSYDHHGSFSRDSAAGTLATINDAMIQGVKWLAAADYVIITFGTSWIYRLKSNGSVVANCHKQPATLFSRERLSVDDIVAAYVGLLEGPLAGKQVLFTVSPVRHMKDGFEENSLSKAILRTAIAQLVERYPNVSYFPSFEIMNDDLRDYRFYADDMIHPSPVAVNYIWEKFIDFAMDQQTKSLLPRLEKLHAALSHRKLHSDVGTDLFKNNSLRLIEELRKDLPWVDLSTEIEHFRE